jgi:hypothetical protein
MALEDQQRLEEIYNTKLHRLRLLEKRQAIEGFNTPPEVIIEIEKTRAEIQPVERALNHAADVQTAEDMGAGGRFLALDKRIESIDERLDERMDRFERAIERRLDRMEGHSEERYRAQEAKHDSGTLLYRFLFALLSFGVILALVLCAFFIGWLVF